MSSKNYFAPRGQTNQDYMAMFLFMEQMRMYNQRGTPGAHHILPMFSQQQLEQQRLLQSPEVYLNGLLDLNARMPGRPARPTPKAGVRLRAARTPRAAAPATSGIFRALMINSTFIKAANLLVYVFVLAVNVYFMNAPGKELNPYRDDRPLTFFMWCFVRILLAVCLVYQFTRSGHEAMVRSLHLNFLVLELSVLLWLYFWQSGQFWIALIQIYSSMNQIKIINARIRIYAMKHNYWEMLLRGTFIVYYEWSQVLIFANVYAAYYQDVVDEGMWSYFIALILFGSTLVHVAHVNQVNLPFLSD